MLELVDDAGVVAQENEGVAAFYPSRFVLINTGEPEGQHKEGAFVDPEVHRSKGLKDRRRDEGNR